MSAARDFSTISPSAKALLLVKAQTSLPHERRAAELLFGAEAVARAEEEAAANPAAAGRRGHFELRARSLDEALAWTGERRVVELAAGLSFRGLALAEREDVVYLDTDLPGIVDVKRDLASRLHPGPLVGSHRIQPLDALDAPAFAAAVDSLPVGPIAILHEGLLMYLGDDEKARLAANVRDALARRGGAWITADVYVRSETHLYREERTKRFLEEHRVEENKFADFAAAEAFFAGQGFAIARRFAPSSDPWRVRETWALEPR